MKYSVIVRRIVREDTSIEVEADSKEAAQEKAMSLATSVEPEKWDCYDCEYWRDDADIEEIKEEANEQ